MSFSDLFNNLVCLGFLGGLLPPLLLEFAELTLKFFVESLPLKISHHGASRFHFFHSSSTPSKAAKDPFWEEDQELGYLMKEVSYSTKSFDDCITKAEWY